MARRRLRPLLVSPLALLLAAGFARGVDHVVIVTDDPTERFDPQFLTIQKGDTVTWKNLAGTHNVVADDASFTSGSPTAAPWTFVHTFATEGTITYSCTLHAADGQTGTIFVRPARAATEVAYTVNSWDMQRTEPATSAEGAQQFFARYSGTFQSSVHLPAGAKLTGLELSACDDPLVGGGTSTSLLVCPEPVLYCSAVATVDTTPSATETCRIFVTNIADGPIVDNLNNTYGLRVTANSDYFRGVKVYYKRGVGPAPTTATFADVPTSHPFFRVIEALAASGITQGCGNGNFCPNDPVTRGAMASFLARALGLFWPN